MFYILLLPLVVLNSITQFYLAISLLNTTCKACQSFSELLLNCTGYAVKKLSLPDCLNNITVVFQKNIIYDSFTENYSHIPVVFTTGNLAQIHSMGVKLMLILLKAVFIQAINSKKN